MSKLALLDVDGMIHIIAHAQYSAGNRDNKTAVQSHVRRFTQTVLNKVGTDYILFFQDVDHKNFRNEILPEYKKHRKSSDAIKLWKPVIIEQLKLLGAIGLHSIESDDAVSVLQDHILRNKLGEVLIVSNDKDMFQISGRHYNPFKKGLVEEDRWKYITLPQANRFFWLQVLTGDSTDMPNELCGVQGVALKTAEKIFNFDNNLTFAKIVQKVYTNKYGKAGFNRANLTYKMVRLLKGSESYINQAAQEEVDKVLNNYTSYIIKYKNDVETLFS